MSDPKTYRVFINGMSAGTGGGYTVAREVTQHMALARPDWRFTLAVVRDHPLQREFEHESFADNVEIFWAPSKAISPRSRGTYEQGELTQYINEQSFDATFQLNGMILPKVNAPTLAHFQDPHPYRPEAWTTLQERVTAWFKRRAHRVALKQAAVCGWTSHYLEDLICTRQGLKPKRSVVFYNGVPESWAERAEGVLPPWDSRPMELVTVSHVWPYKRQSLVIEALAQLRKIPGLEDLRYRILGGCVDDYQAELRQLAQRLGVEDAVSIEGRVSDEVVQQALASARAMPLMSLCESFGIPTIEAMAYGTPVVVADCCALPEVCGEAAVACPPDDLDALVKILRGILTDPGQVEQLRQAGAKRVGRFRWKLIGEQMADEVEGMIQQAR